VTLAREMAGRFIRMASGANDSGTRAAGAIAAVSLAVILLAACTTSSSPTGPRVASPLAPTASTANAGSPATGSPAAGSAAPSLEGLSVTLEPYATVKGGPLAIVAPRDGTGRLFVASQDGLAWVVPDGK